MLAGAIHRLVDFTSDWLASPEIFMATLTWHAVEDPWTALELGQRVAVSRPLVESARSTVNDSPVKARRARTYAESRDAGTGSVLWLSGPATRPVQPEVTRRQHNPTNCNTKRVIRTSVMSGST